MDTVQWIISTATDYHSPLVYSTGARHRMGNNKVEKSRVQWTRGRAKSFLICYKIWMVPSTTDNGNSQGMINSEGSF